MRTVDVLHDLQRADSAISEARRRLAEIATALNDHAELDAARLAQAASQQAVKSIESDQRDQELATESLRATVAEIEKKMYGGKVVSPKELGNLDKEAAMLRKQIGTREDTLLALYDRLEAAQEVAGAAKTRLKWAEAEQKERGAALSAEKREIEATIARLDQQRAELRSQVEPRPLATYDRLLNARGIAVSELRQRTCQNCRITIPNPEIARARAGRELVPCPNCGRILWDKM